MVVVVDVGDVGVVTEVGWSWWLLVGTWLWLLTLGLLWLMMWRVVTSVGVVVVVGVGVVREVESPQLEKKTLLIVVHDEEG